MSVPADRVRVVDPGGLEEDMRYGDESRPLVDRLEEAVLVDRDSIVRPHDDDARPEPFRQCFTGVAYRGEIQLRHHDRVAGTGEIEG